MFATTFLIGLAGSLHCVGMCGPLVMAVSGRKGNFRTIAYNIGRILTYGLLGSIVSFLGMGLSFAGLQTAVSIAVGVLILFVAFFNLQMTTPAFLNQAIVKMIVTIKSKVHLNPVFMGMVNGILPCGMTLVALSYCITLEWPADGFMAMMLFGIGTLPAMLGLSTLIRWSVNKLKIGYRSIQVTLMVVSGILLIGRGISDYAAQPHQKDDNGIVVCGSNH